MVTSDILVEGVVPFPASITLKNQKGGRTQLTVNDTCYNFYDGEAAYFHADNGQLGIIVAIEGKEPLSIKQRLKQLVGWKGE